MNTADKEWKTVKTRIFEDLQRCSQKKSRKYLIKYLLFSPSFQLSFWYRIARYYTNYKKKNFAIYIYKHFCYKYGISISLNTDVKGGLLFPHHGCSQLNAISVGKNFTLYQGATVGSVRGKGRPTIGENVVVSCNALVLGGIKVGNNVMIGAGAVVVNDIPDNAVVVGNPAKIINYNGEQNVEKYR